MSQTIIVFARGRHKMTQFGLLHLFPLIVGLFVSQVPFAFLFSTSSDFARGLGQKGMT